MSSSRPRRQQKQQPNTDDGPPDEATAPSDSPSVKQRRERKRQTDRLAQQQHRKRQKKYIDQLEHKLSVLQSDNQSDVGRLGLENFRLRQALTSLHELWGEMEPLIRRHHELVEQSGVLNLDEALVLGATETAGMQHNGHDPKVVAGHRASKGLVDETIPEPGLDQVQQKSIPHSLLPTSPDSQVNLSSPPLLPDADFVQGMGFDTEMQLDDLHLLEEEGTHTVQQGDMGQDTTLDPITTEYDTQLTDSITIDTNQQSLHHERQPNTSYGYLRSPTRQLRHSRHSRHLRTSPQPPHQRFLHEQQKGGTSSYSFDAFDSFLRPGDDDTVALDHLFESQVFQDLLPGMISPRWFTADLGSMRRPPSPLSLPLLPPCKDDELIHDMMERARSSMDQVGPPSLLEFLIDNPRNTLSMDLKKFLEPVRTGKGTSEFLATYWVLYLLLRWYILRTDETYESLPLWLRPTPTQLTILHPVAADLIAWPNIRDSMISVFQSDTNSMQQVSSDIGRHLRVQIDASQLDLNTGPVSIASQILNLANWNLDDGFFDRYPEWRGMAK